MERPKKTKKRMFEVIDIVLIIFCAIYVITVMTLLMLYGIGYLKRHKMCERCVKRQYDLAWLDTIEPDPKGIKLLEELLSHQNGPQASSAMNEDPDQPDPLSRDSEQAL